LGRPGDFYCARDQKGRTVPALYGAGSWSVTFENVEVVRREDRVLMWRVGQKIVGVPPRRMLSGTTILTVDRGRLVLAREMALNLGLI